MSNLIGYKYTDEQILFMHSLREDGNTWTEISKLFNEEYPSDKQKSPETLRLIYEKHSKGEEIRYHKPEPKVLVFDIETAPIMGKVWDLWNQNLGLEQIEKDWHVLSWSAKWLGAPETEVMYMDQSKAPNVEDDSIILGKIWELLEECDIVITQNGKRFDVKKLNARFVLHGFHPPSSYRHIDTCELAKRVFGFTSNKLEYMTDKLCVKYKKKKHKKFPGFSLWNECLKNNPEAWAEMKEYNMYDVLSLEELYNVLAPWDHTINFSVYTESLGQVCKCGSVTFKNSGFHYTGTGKYQKHKCVECGHETRDSENLLSKEKRKSLRRSIR